MVHIDLCTEATFLGKDCPYDAEAPARRGRVTVMVRDVPPGRYAAVGYHDANANRDPRPQRARHADRALRLQQRPADAAGPALVQGTARSTSPTRTWK